MGIDMNDLQGKARGKNFKDEILSTCYSRSISKKICSTNAFANVFPPFKNKHDPMFQCTYTKVHFFVIGGREGAFVGVAEKQAKPAPERSGTITPT